MAEGDSIVRMARSIERAFDGRGILAAEAPNPRSPVHATAGRLAGHRLERIEPRGKHLILYFGDELALHSHMGMSGGWHVYPVGRTWRRPRRSAWLVLELGEVTVAEFGGPTLRLVHPAKLDRDPRLARLGPDILDGEESVARASANVFTAGSLELGIALMSQRLVAGVGNIFKSEACFEAGLNPWRTVASLRREQVDAVVAVAASQMKRAVETGRRPGRVYRKSRRLCPRCGTAIRSRGQGDENRITYWCPGCQN